MNKTLIKEFQSPSSQYRGAPFWAWNGKLEPEELRSQIRTMKEMGLGGFFMHSRVGLNTPYLSKDWFKCVNACINEAEKLGMKAWLYDEDRWPSGAAGGLVTKNVKYRSRKLTCQAIKKASEVIKKGATVAVFKAVVNGDTISHVQRLKTIPKSESLKGNNRFIVTQIHIDEPECWYNGFTYLDTMNHEAVKEFIKVTHEAYRKNCGRHFGKSIPGIFTDEPNVQHDNTPEGWSRIPWTESLPSVFKKRYGYDILDRLPELFYNIEGQEVSQARYHYRDCMTWLFVDAFARQIGEWCQKNAIDFTGHVLQEDTLSFQTQSVGNCMRFYEHMQAPGMDLLTEHTKHYITAKQVSSMARQFDRKWRLTETYGCTGWDFPFLGHKALSDWQTALGINLRCQHLSWYTMKGEAKRDYPAGIHYQSPWYKDYSKVEDYYARITSIMTKGKEVRDLLVIHPIESMWVTFRGWASQKDLAFENKFETLCLTLLKENIDFDFGDEEVMARHATLSSRAEPRGDSVIDNGRNTPTPVIKIKYGQYKAVILPPMLTIRSTTLSLLKRFRADGGKVVFAGQPSRFVDAVESSLCTDFARECVVVPEKGLRAVKALEINARVISIQDNNKKEIPGVLHLLREDAQNNYLFVANTGLNQKQFMAKDDIMAVNRTCAYDEVTISGLPASGSKPVELDPDTGAITLADAHKQNGCWHIRTTFSALGSRLFIIPKQKLNHDYKAKPSYKALQSKSISSKKWAISLTDYNAVVLDQPAFKIAGGKRQKPEDILQVDRKVRHHLGIEPRGGAMVQPWAQPTPVRQKSTDVTLEYDFKVNHIPDNNLFLAIETPDTFKAALNGNSIDMNINRGWWCDKSLQKIPIDKSFFIKGQNKLTLICHYAQTHSGLEIVYLLGSFGVKLANDKPVITACPQNLSLGNWVKQDLPFYSGSVIYQNPVNVPALKKGQRLFLKVPKYKGTAAAVLVNGQRAGLIAWEPNEIDITALVKGSSIELGIEIISHRRNSHGPLHNKITWPVWTGSGEFTGNQNNGEYNLVPCGLMSQPVLEVRG